MRYAIISDIHSNLEALQAVLRRCQDQGVRRIFCAGDIIGYGANPKECIELIKAHNILSVAGNHEWGILGKLDLDSFNAQGQASIEWTRTKLSESDSNFLKSLELVYTQDDFVMVHGSLNNPESFTSQKEIDLSADSFFLMKSNICFVGHTHRPKIFVFENGKTDYLEGSSFKINSNRKYIVNVGSVGQPRDGNPKASFCIFDPDLLRVEMHRVDYDFNLTQQRIFDEGLPIALAERLAVGH
jgi:predicted phosphodiesterase